MCLIPANTELEKCKTKVGLKLEDCVYPQWTINANNSISAFFLFPVYVT